MIDEFVLKYVARHRKVAVQDIMTHFGCDEAVISGILTRLVTQRKLVAERGDENNTSYRLRTPKDDEFDRHCDQLLEFLHDQPDSSIYQIAAQLDLAYATAYRVVHKMAQVERVTLTHSHVGRRTTLVALGSA